MSYAGDSDESDAFSDAPSSEDESSEVRSRKESSGVSPPPRLIEIGLQDEAVASLISSDLTTSLQDEAVANLKPKKKKKRSPLSDDEGEVRSSIW